MSRAEFSHGNFFMTVTDNFNQLYDFLTTKLSFPMSFLWSFMANIRFSFNKLSGLARLAGLM